MITNLLNGARDTYHEVLPAAIVILAIPLMYFGLRRRGGPVGLVLLVALGLAIADLAMRGRL